MQTAPRCVLFDWQQTAFLDWPFFFFFFTSLHEKIPPKKSQPPQRTSGHGICYERAAQARLIVYTLTRAQGGTCQTRHLRLCALALHAVAVPGHAPLNFCSSAKIACAAVHLNKSTHTGIHMIPLWGFITGEYCTKVHVTYQSLLDMCAQNANLWKHDYNSVFSVKEYKDQVIVTQWEICYLGLLDFILTTTLRFFIVKCCTNHIIGTSTTASECLWPTQVSAYLHPQNSEEHTITEVHSPWVEPNQILTGKRETWTMEKELESLRLRQ